MHVRFLLGVAAVALAVQPAAGQGAGGGARFYPGAPPWYADAARGEAEGAARPSSVFFGAGSGLGFNPSRGDSGFQSDPARLRGPGLALDLPPPDGAFIGYRFDRLTLTSGVRQRIDAPEAIDGSRLDLGASYGFTLNPRHLVTLAGRLTVGQSRAPGLPVGTYAADTLTRAGLQAGEPGMGLRLSWTYSASERLFVDTSLGFSRVQAGAEAAQGFDRSTTTFGTTFGYRW